MEATQTIEAPSITRKGLGGEVHGTFFSAEQHDVYLRVMLVSKTNKMPKKKGDFYEEKIN